LLKCEADRYDTNPEIKKRVMDQLPPFANMIIVDYLEKELNFHISPEMAHELAVKTVRYVNGTIKRTNITPGGAGNNVKPLIDQAVKDLVQRKHPCKIYDSDIREEFDNIAKDKLLPPIGNKEFYTWVGELGYQWVVEPEGKPVRSHGNRRVLSCFRSDGTHLTKDA
jgi:hypothetical protein